MQILSNVAMFIARWRSLCAVKPSPYVTSNPGKLNLAIPLCDVQWVLAMVKAKTKDTETTSSA